jgi:DNA-binding NarL/FixJ family response regulator
VNQHERRHGAEPSTIVSDVPIHGTGSRCHLTRAEPDVLVELGAQAVDPGDQLGSSAARTTEEPPSGRGQHQAQSWWNGGVSRSGSDLEAAARRRHSEGDYAAALATYEDAFARYQAEGRIEAAARAARTIGWFRGWVFGEWAVYQGWSARAETLLERSGSPSAVGWLRYAAARRGSDLQTQRGQYLEAIEIARTCDDADLECEAIASLGMMLVFSGLVEEGIAHLDHALATICGGTVTELPVVEGCLCGLLNACERTHDVRRAEEWLAAADEVMRRGNLMTVAGYCRAHYAGILLSAGRWSEAEDELTKALALLTVRSRVRESALCRLADLRVRQGRLEEAAVLLDGLEHHEDARLPLASVHALQGHPDLALEIVDRALGAPALPDYTEAPWLALAVDCHLGLGELDQARSRSERLTEVARNQSSKVVQALAAFARGRVCVAMGDGDPRACWHQAMSLYSQVRMPVEVARARLELARTLAADRPSVAVAEATAALAALRSHGATRAADDAAALLRRLGAPARTGPKRRAALTQREEEVLALVGHGLTNAEIAARLYISTKTVEHHVGRVLAKLGARSRSEAVAYAARTANSGRA